MTAFRIVRDATAWWPVSFDQVAADGAVVSHRIELRFVRVGVAEFNAMFAGDPPATSRALWDRVVRGWRGIEDDTGGALPMTDANVDALLDEANFAEGFGVGYARFWKAIAETRLGNSNASPAGGPATAAGPTGAPPATPPPSPPPSPTPA